VTKLPTGTGIYIWEAHKIFGGDVAKIVAACKEAGLRHVFLKVADGPYSYPPASKNYNLRPLVDAFHAAGIEVWGWQYIYLNMPTQEADVAARRVKELSLDGFIIDAEVECKGQAARAKIYCDRLRQLLPGVSIGLSSYRYPSYHGNFPWKEFRERVDFDAPQVYWEQAHNAGAQLQRSYGEFDNMTPRLPYVPTGAAYSNKGWTATAADIDQFIDRALEIGLSAWNFWSMQHALALGLWSAIDGDNALPSGKITLRVVAPAGLRIRSGPGTMYARVGLLKFLTLVQADEQMVGAWARLADGRGWVCTDWTVRV